jgi:isoleucyl-tRNA synthetase
MSSKKYYPEVDSNPNFPKQEQDILAFWQKENLFQKSIDQRDSDNSFIFYDGPPFANGLPHYGHLLTGFVKDIVARYQTMKGKRVERRFGWDCHGLPAEMGAEKDLQISGRSQIMEFGVDKFNEYCQQSVMKYASSWEEYVNRQARWVDFKNDYKTMDINFMESVLWAFKQLYDKGLVYESMRVMPYSWACETPLSNFETRLDNSYRERVDKAITVAFTLTEAADFLPKGCSSYKILVWTTTPWTLPSNLALAVGSEITYSYIIRNGECLIMAKSAAAKYEDEYQESIEFQGSKLVGLSYIPLFPYFKDHPGSFTILSGDFVTDGDGTAVVHMAPGFGEDDQILCAAHNIEIVCPVDSAGKFTAEVTDFAGLQVFDSNDGIIKYLKNISAWIKTEQFAHNYPHCWRTDTPLIYKALPSWYIEVTKIRDQMVANNQQITWIPDHIKDGLFGKWLAGARDWSISRNRFWGTPIPIWKSNDEQYPRIDVYGSIAELERDFKVKVTNLHKPYIDDLTRPNPDDPTGKTMMVRIPDVFDCWFESGSMPYAQAHYPFENKEQFEKSFPADFIVEYTAQTRGWFYTLMVLSTALFNRPPFLNCICHGVILDEKGQKLSKRLNNFADPLEFFAKYGADALRFLMASSPVMRGNELLIDKQGNMLKDVLRLHIKPIWNAYNFFTIYANADGIKANFNLNSTNLMDQYIVAKAKIAVESIQTSMDRFDTITACCAVADFFEVLNNWYIRRSRTRFWKSEQDSDKQASYDTLYSVLNLLCRAAAPLLPLTLEEIYLGLENRGIRDASKSVHLADFPDVSLLEDREELSRNMDKVRDICNAALFIRNSSNIRVRQPLSSLSVIGYNIALQAFADIIKDEVNVKEILWSSDIEAHATFKLQPNFPLLGKRLPLKVKDVIAAIKRGEWQRQGDVVLVADEILSPQEFVLTLEPKSKENTQALSSQDALVVLNLEISEELRGEGLARDLVRLIQQQRKIAGLHISDRISLKVQVDDRVKDVLLPFTSYINEQTLGEVDFVASIDETQHQFSSEVELDEVQVKIALSVIYT